MAWAGTSSDPSKYQKLPRAIEARFRWLQRIGFCALLLIAVILVGGDGLWLRTRALRKSATVEKGSAATVIKSAGIWTGSKHTTSTLEDTSPDEEDGSKQDGEEFTEDGSWDAPASGKRRTGADPGDEWEPAAAPVTSVGKREDDTEEGDAQQPEDAWSTDGDAGGDAQEEDGQAEGDSSEPQEDSNSQEPAEEDGGADTDSGAGKQAGQGDADVSEGSEGDGEEEQEQDELRTVEKPADWEPSASHGCNGFFGNGFDEFHTILGPTAETGKQPQLRCIRHPATTSAMCMGRNMLLRADRITMSRGGESLDQVMGRREEEEVPSFQPGATEFITAGYDSIPVEPSTSYLDGREEGGVSIQASLPQALMGQIERADKYKGLQLSTAVKVNAKSSERSCAVRVREPVIFLTRMEYANLFHTSTDWYNAWQAARMAGLKPTTQYNKLIRKLTPTSLLAPKDGSPRFAAHVVFMDGHNAGPMDDGWTALFLSVSYAKHFTGPACFDRPILAPFGYNAAISMGIQQHQTDCWNEQHVRQFGNDFVRGLGITPRDVSTCADSAEGQDTPILFVRRVHYLAHPRHNGQIVRRLDNEDEIVTSLTNQVSKEGSGRRMLNGMFSAMSLKEQVQAAQEACVMVGAHGAGLSHILFSPPGVHMLELQPPAFQRPHFIAYTSWAGSKHHLWAMGTSTPRVGDVLAHIDQTVQAAVTEQSAAAERREGHNTP